MVKWVSVALCASCGIALILLSDVTTVEKRGGFSFSSIQLMTPLSLPSERACSLACMRLLMFLRISFWCFAWQRFRHVCNNWCRDVVGSLFGLPRNGARRG